MKYVFFALLFFSELIQAQKIPEADKSLHNNLKKTIDYLSDDKLEGRRTGTAGEALAYEYIQVEFRKIGLTVPSKFSSYLQAFPVNEGRAIDNNTKMSFQGRELKVGEEYFPLAYSGNAKQVEFSEKDENVVIVDLSEVIAANSSNPHFDIKENVLNLARDAEKSGKKILVIMNTSGVADNLSFEEKDRTEKLSVPVIYLKRESQEKKQDMPVAALSGITIPPDYSVTVLLADKISEGHNVVGFLDNNAANTIVIGAHYDHLGYGEDHTSLYSGKEKMIHNGADDNASGTAALIELARWLKTSGLKSYNYLFVSFSGEELGLFGSKYFTDHAPMDLSKINFMINMDMVGRLNDSTHGLTVGGYGTSPSWGSLIQKNNAYLKINTDSSGSGPSDHTSFYKKDIPVLFFFTGSHKDYHKPSDDADKINYPGEIAVVNYLKDLLTKTDQMPKMAFAKTREAAAGKNTFKVSLGIMPDYTFTEEGVRVDGVSDNRPAQRAGIQTGDILKQLGEHPFSDVQTYMNALNQFNKGDTTHVKLLRDKKEMILTITF